MNTKIYLKERYKNSGWDNNYIFWLLMKAEEKENMIDGEAAQPTTNEALLNPSH